MTNKCYKVLKILKDKIDRKIRNIQNKCEHPNATFIIKWHNDFEYDDSKFRLYKCPDCGKQWTEDINEK